MPFLLHNENGITEENLKTKIKEFKNMDDLVLFQGLNNVVNNMTVGIKGLKMKCPECGLEVHTSLTFPKGCFLYWNSQMSWEILEVKIDNINQRIFSLFQTDIESNS